MHIRLYTPTHREREREREKELYIYMYACMVCLYRIDMKVDLDFFANTKIHVDAEIQTEARPRI